MRVFLIVLDSFGVGELPDSHLFGDKGSNTAKSVMSSAFFDCPNLMGLGLQNMRSLNKKPVKTTGCYGMAAEKSLAKDTIAGHWELMGVITEKPFPLFPKGFPDELVEKITEITGSGILCNLPYSGTEVIRDYGMEHLATKKPIIYTSADSVLQIACHEDIVPLEKLYEYCEKIRGICVGEYGVARVIARPFTGKPGEFYRTAGRHDYSVEPPHKTVLDLIKSNGLDVIAIGKISAVFNGRGITESYETKNNNEGLTRIFEMLNRDFNGLCFANLVDFDMLYGHRNDIDGYAKAISEFDKSIGNILKELKNGDLLIITADHGCDPATPSTDHSREYIPILCAGNVKKDCNIGIRNSFADIGATVCEGLGIKQPENGISFYKEIIKNKGVLMKTDIQIAQEAAKLPISEIAAKLGLTAEDIEPYGKYKAKLSFETLEKIKNNKPGKLILVTAISPTPAGEGKTTTTVGLGQGMAKIGKKAVVALREPSLGPVFGMKGGATGGGYSQVVPMEEINLHFTGDFHAITSANNLLCALTDNHIQQGNELNINPKRILINRALDMNDRVLRKLVVGLGGSGDGVTREDSFSITVATEMMAILCLSENLSDLKEKCGKIIVAYDYNGNPVTAAQLGANGAMAALMRDAVKPNLVQTTENTPCLIHGGPFANIAHGCNSIIATRAALGLGDYCITEAGFGSDLGAQKFFDIKCRLTGLKPSVVVIVATVRALKYNGGVKRGELAEENLTALESGIVNLKAHIENMKNYKIPIVIALNRFHTDTDAEAAFVTDYCAKLGVKAVESRAFASGGEGAADLAAAVCELCETESKFEVLYPDNASIAEKIEIISKKIYRAAAVEFTQTALASIAKIETAGFSSFPVCIAKTQYSLSDDPSKLGCPEGCTIHIRDVKVSAGAGFAVAYAGDIMTMPGLPKRPAAEKIDIDFNGNITGLN